MRVDGLEEGPETPKVSDKDVQPSLNWDDIPSDEDDDGSVDWSSINLADIPSDEDDDGSVDYDAIDEKEVDLETFDFKEREKNGEIIIIDEKIKIPSIGNLQNRVAKELKDAVNRYFTKVLPATNGEGADSSSELQMYDIALRVGEIMSLIQLQEGPDKSSYVDMKVINDAINDLYVTLNKSYREVAIKNGYRYSGIYRKTDGSPTGRMFGLGYEYLSEKEETSSRNDLISKFPAVLSGKDADFNDRITEMRNRSVYQKETKKTPKGYRVHTVSDEYERLLKDEDMKSSLGAMIAEQFRLKGSKSKKDLTKYFLLEGEKIDGLKTPGGMPETDFLPWITDWSMRIFAAKSVGALTPETPTYRYFINKEKDTIIQLPENSSKDDISPSVNMDYIAAALESVDRSVRPDKSSIVRKINFMDESDYPGTLQNGELAHANFATLQINVFMNKISDLYESFQSADPERKDEMLKQFASPKVWDSMENMYKYTVAHELGHIMAAVIWDHKELDSNFHKSGPPTWRFRSGIKDMQKEINPLKQLEPVSKYGNESTDEYWAEAYAKWLFDDEASDSFKKILDDYGLIRGKARRWVTDDDSTNPAAKSSLSESAQKSFEFLDKVTNINMSDTVAAKEVLEKMIERMPYVGEYGVDAAKQTLRKIADNLSGTFYAANIEGKELWESVGSFLQAINSEWNGSSNYKSGMASMYAIRELFNITNALPLTGRTSSGADFDGRKKRVDEVVKFFDDNPDAFTFFKQMIKANYDHTQEVLQKAGVKEILLYRGWNSAGDIKDKTVVQSRPLNSFSVNEDIARNFLGSGGSLTAVVVPAKDIYTFWKLFKGGHAGESEVILMGGAREMYAYAWNEWPDIKNLVGTGKEVLID